MSGNDAPNKKSDIIIYTTEDEVAKIETTFDQLVDGKLIINEEEAEAIRIIYDQYVHTDIGANGLHEPIVLEEAWQTAQVKLLAQAKKYEHINRGKDEHTHLLSGIVKCPVCGAGMYGNKSIKHKKDGTKYKDFYYYGCKHRSMIRGHKCDYKKQIREELLDDAVAGDSAADFSVEERRWTDAKKT